MIKVKLKELLTAVKTAGLAADPKSTMPALSCVKLHASDGVLTVRATDLTTDISVMLFADGTLDTVVGAKALASMLAACLPKGGGKRNADLTVDLDTVERSLTINAGVTMKVDTFPERDYPKAPVCDLPDPVTYDATVLTDVLDFILPAVSADETRYHLNAACFDNGSVVSTDGHRLHLQKGLPDVEGRYLLARSSSMMLRKVIATYADKEVIAGFNGPLAHFTCGMATVTCKLVDAQFPPWGQVIPQCPDKSLTANRDSFLNALRQASILSSDKTYGVKVSVKPDGCAVEADNPDSGKAVAPFTVAARVDYSHVQGFNARYLMEFLGCLKSSDVTLEMSGELDPLKIVDGDRTAVIMPMRI